MREQQMHPPPFRLSDHSRDKKKSLIRRISRRNDREGEEKKESCRLSEFEVDERQQSSSRKSHFYFLFGKFESEDGQILTAHQRLKPDFSSEICTCSVTFCTVYLPVSISSGMCL